MSGAPTMKIVFLALLLSGCATIAPVDDRALRREIFFNLPEYRAEAAHLTGPKARAYAAVMVDVAGDYGLSQADIDAMRSLPLEDQWPWIGKRTAFQSSGRHD